MKSFNVEINKRKKNFINSHQSLTVCGMFFLCIFSHQYNPIALCNSLVNGSWYVFLPVKICRDGEYFLILAKRPRSDGGVFLIQLLLPKTWTWLACSNKYSLNIFYWATWSCLSLKSKWSNNGNFMFVKHSGWIYEWMNDWMNEWTDRWWMEEW